MISFVVGNHDMELLFAGVQERLREALGHPERVLFPGIRHQRGQVHVEHGQQHDPLFAIDAERPFLEHAGETVLNLPWGTVALLEVAMQYLPELHQLDRLKPKRAVLAALPEVKDLLLGAYWRYWTRDFWQSYWATRDPLRRVSWSMLKEVAYRFGTGDPDVSMQDCRRLLHDRRDETTLIVLGHEHEPAWWSSAGRRVLRTGCFRNEWELDVEGGAHRLLPKVYAEVFLRGDVPVRSHLVEVDAPPPPDPWCPATWRRCSTISHGCARRRWMATTRPAAATSTPSPRSRAGACPGSSRPCARCWAAPAACEIARSRLRPGRSHLTFRPFHGSPREKHLDRARLARPRRLWRRQGHARPGRGPAARQHPP